MIGLDIDGVLADFAGYVQARLRLTGQQTAWDFAPELEEAVDAICADPATWVSLDPLPTARQDLAIIGRTARPVFITAIHPRFAQLRQWWLEDRFGAILRHGFRLYVAPSSQKAALAVELGLTHFIEDKTETANEMAAAGLASYLVPTPYMGAPGAGVTVGTLHEYALAVRDGRG